MRTRNNCEFLSFCTISGNMRIVKSSSSPSTPCFTHFTMKSLLMLAFLVASAHCAIYYVRQNEVPGHENQCYDEIDNSFYNPRERMSSERGVCTRVTCLGRRENGKVVIEKATCGTVMVMPGCQIIEDLSKPYPDCCPRVVHCREVIANYTA